MTCLVHIQRGNRVLDTLNGDTVTVLDYYLVPNGIDDPTLVCIVVVQCANGGKVSATADYFARLPSEPYEVRYPSDMDRVS